MPVIDRACTRIIIPTQITPYLRRCQKIRHAIGSISYRPQNQHLERGSQESKIPDEASGQYNILPRPLRIDDEHISLDQDPLFLFLPLPLQTLVYHPIDWRRIEESPSRMKFPVWKPALSCQAGHLGLYQLDIFAWLHTTRTVAYCKFNMVGITLRGIRIGELGYNCRAPIV